MNRTKEALKRQTRPGWLVLWAALAALGLCSDFVSGPIRIPLEEQQ